MFPGYRIRAVTNGVHLPTWAHPAFRDLFNKHFPSWGHEPEMLVQADQLSDDEIWGAHMTAKRELVDFVSAKTGVHMDPEKPIIGYARRMTSYKRPELLFTSLDALRRIDGVTRSRSYSRARRTRATSPASGTSRPSIAISPSSRARFRSPSSPTTT